MNTTRSAARRANPISWVTTIIVMPSVASSVITSSTSLIISGSSALVGSSNSISTGSMASALAIATRCCCPPESWAGSLSACSATPTLASSSSALVRAAARLAPRTRTGPSMTFCSTVLCANRLNDWNTMPTSARRPASSAPSTGTARPSISTLPPSGDSSRLMHRHSVDLPDPEGPMTTTTSPRPTSRSMPTSTGVAPNDLRSPVMRTRGISAAPTPMTAPPPIRHSPRSSSANYGKFE